MKKIKILLVLAIIFSGVEVFAASPTLYLKTSSDTLAPGSTVNISILLDTSDAINALDLGISYPKDKLEYLNADNSDSIVNIWQEKPADVGGSIEFSGGMLDPYTGTGGHIITLQFKLLKVGDAKLVFNKTKLFLANGQGTEVTGASKSMTIGVVEEAKAEILPVATFKSTPEDREIAQGLSDYKVEKAKSNLISLLLATISIVLISILVYNKRKRKL